MALSIADHGYVMENGKIVMDKPAAELLEDEDVREFYLGLARRRRGQILPRRQALQAAQEVAVMTATAERAAAQPQIETPVLEFDDVQLSFAGVKAIDGVSFTVGGSELFAIIGPNGAGKTSIFNVLSGVYRPQSGRVTFAGTDLVGKRPDEIAELGDRPHLPEHRAVRQPDRARQPDARPPPPQHLRRAVLVRLARQGAAVRAAQPGSGRGHHRLPRAGAVAAVPRRATALRRAEARRARPRAGHGAQAPAARRAGGRDEPRGDRGHGPLHPRRPRRARASRSSWSNTTWAW